MTAWRSSVTQQKKLGLPAPPHMPVVHDAGKALWRGLEPILCASDEGDSRPGLIRWLEEIRTEILESEKHVLDLVTIHAQGMTYGTQSSVFETGIDDTLSLNSVMFRHDYSGIASVLDVVKCTDGAVLALSQFVRNLRAASGDKESPRKQRNKFENGHMRILMGCFVMNWRLSMRHRTQLSMQMLGKTKSIAGCCKWGGNIWINLPCPFSVSMNRVSWV